MLQAAECATLGPRVLAHLTVSQSRYRKQMRAVVLFA